MINYYYCHNSTKAVLLHTHKSTHIRYNKFIQILRLAHCKWNKFYWTYVVINEYMACLIVRLAVYQWSLFVIENSHRSIVKWLILNIVYSRSGAYLLKLFHLEINIKIKWNAKYLNFPMGTKMMTAMMVWCWWHIEWQRVNENEYIET